ncbi:membrane-bound lytic murein transglycosylase MltF [Wenzhouxiangella limi]|uniref:Membrane-bound lytic murein transglycosylase F n=1 Tax=Wenzhouxiangella limi TaxID=2707351 RepID=A0A845V2T9_9GAMM|nr:membrane-bound lytic murein transglycosylase MltF [Wenzhouxiangella limi]NDY96922.1 membrane-bound lytic murein transglycosylase MltF [Wenzhouxiangella limi]
MQSESLAIDPSHEGPAASHRRWRPRGPGPGRVLLGLVILLFGVSGDSGLNFVEKVQARGTLVMLTLNGASTYYIGADGETGFEYDLAQHFAERIGVPLEVIPVDAIGSLIPTLESGRGDFIAANFSRTPARMETLRFGPAYENVRPVVVYRRGSRRPEDLDDLSDGELVIPAGTVYAPWLARNHPAVSLREDPDASVEDLLDAVSGETITYTILDSNVFELNRRFFPAVRKAFELPVAQELAWATRRRHDDSLAQQMREFFYQADQNGMLADVRQRHYDHLDTYEPVGTFTFMRQVRDRLPELRSWFEEAAVDTGLDWRLLAAVGYQESHWDPQATSRTGVRGVMMLTRRTAQQLGVENRLDPAQSIHGGARYLVTMLERVPERIEYPDRLWLALAAYNIGYGHLEDARVLTQRQGGDPDRWLDVREHLPLLTQERWYRQTRFGYARGYEPVHFVENVRTFFEILSWMEGREHPLLADAGNPGGEED